LSLTEGQKVIKNPKKVSNTWHPRNIYYIDSILLSFSPFREKITITDFPCGMQFNYW